MEIEFPLLSADMLAVQDRQSLVFDYRYYSLCYIYIRKYNDTWFVDIYLYHNKVFEKQILMDRFVIAPGCRMEAEDEERFLHFVKDDGVLFDTRTCSDYVSEIAKAAPELNIKEYKDIGMALFHTYYASHRSGIRELLLKAGMEWVACGLDDMVDELHMGHNIEETFEMPIKLLRKLNWPAGVKNVLATAEQRKRAVTVYKKFHSILNDIEFLNEFQIHYLMECMQQKESVDKKLLRELDPLESGWDAEAESYIDGYEVYEQLREYQILRGAMRVEHKIIFPAYPKLAAEDLEKFFEIESLLKTYLAHEDEIEQEMRKNVKRYREYQYEDEKYEIFVPRSCDEIWAESEAQHNCLYQYLMRIVQGKTVVLFMREKVNPQKSLVTIEISGNTIRQARSCCNTLPSRQEREFIEKFSINKKLSYNEIENHNPLNNILNDDRDNLVWNE